MANGTLSDYFQKKTAKDISGRAVSPYSAPADAGGSAPSGGGPSAPSAPSAPKGSAGGGTGFVSFGQYFGGNAPAIQQQAQGAVAKAKNAPQASLNAPAGAPGLGSFRPMSFGPAPTAGQMAQRQTDPLSAQLAQAQRQSAALQPLANYGDMGKDVSAFDQLLGGGVTQRAARQEQQRLGSLRGYLEAEQTQLAQEAASRQQQEQAQYDADRQQEEADFYRRAEEERKYYEALRAQQEQAAAMDEESSFAPIAPDEYDDLGEGGY